MNAIEIEEAVSQLAAEPFAKAEFPFAFLRAFGNKAVTVDRLRKGSASDVAGGVLQRNNAHLAVCGVGEVAQTLAALRASPKTAANRVKFVLATDGVELQAHDMAADEPLACPFPELGTHFGFFLPLAGISTVRQIKDNPVDVKATGRLNKLYIELLKDNPDWATDARRPELNRFMARLIFCFFAEDTGIFLNALFSKTVEQMSDNQSGNTHEVLAELFSAMATPAKERRSLRPWADSFPFVNGGLFEEAGEVPRFSRMARTYLLRAAELSWREINPDIFGSMIQAVADDDERGALGLHYTSVPNILKVLNPLFLDGLREQLEAAGESVRKLRALRRRIAAVRIFDPACGSGNFLVIAYIRMREIEHEIVQRTGDDPKSLIPLTNFYGIEIKGFASEIARLALLIAEFQCDARLISQQAARSMVLPLHRTGQIRTGNALRMDWLTVCAPPTRTVVEEHDLGGPTGRLELQEIGLGEAAQPATYICGNPPYAGNVRQSETQKSDLETVFKGKTRLWKSLDYVSGWFSKAADYVNASDGASAFVSTNSICQGQQVPILWPTISEANCRISFAHTSFKWTNLAAHNAGVSVVIVGLSKKRAGPCTLVTSEAGATTVRQVAEINFYLVPGANVIVQKRSDTPGDRFPMPRGNMPYDGGNLLLSREQRDSLNSTGANTSGLIRRIFGSEELIHGGERYCIWIENDDLGQALSIPAIQNRIEKVRTMRLASSDPGANSMAATPHRFREMNKGTHHTLAMPRVSSENRPYLPIAVLSAGSVVTDLAYALYDAPLWNFALLVSRAHLVWIATVCGKLETRYRYSNTLGWNTFPLPPLTELQKADLIRCAEDILLAREAHYPATIADLYDADTMPDNLRRAHERNDEVLERIYIGRRFRNDTERLEKLFDLYTRIVERQPPAAKPARTKRVG